MSRHAKLSSGESSLSTGSSRGLESGSGSSGSDGAHSLRSEAAVFLSSPSVTSSSGAGSDAGAIPRVQIGSGSESVSLKQAPLDAAPMSSDASRSALSAPIQKNSLDTQKSLKDIVADNVIVNKISGDSSAGRIERLPETLPTQDGAGIKVLFQSHDSGDAQQKPDLIVRRDGTVEVHSQLALEGKKDLLVQVEREVGQLKPTEAQQTAVDELTRYLTGRLKAEHPELANNIKLDDPQRLVSPESRQDLPPALPELDRLPDNARRQIEDMNRFRGGGGGSMPRQDADDYFPRRDVPREPNESEKLAAMKDVVAGFASRGDKHPYEHVQKRENGLAVGRYGFNYNMFADWLCSVDLDAMEEMERQGKLPKGTCAKLRKMKGSIEANKKDPSAKLDPFLEKLKSGNPGELTAAEIKAHFPKEAQELAASAMVGKFALQSLNGDGSIDTGKVALSMQLGRVPDQAEMARPEYRQFMDAARQAYQIAERRQMAPGTDGPIDWTDVNGRTLATAQNSVGKVMWGDFASDVKGGRLGCAASVSEVLEQTGIRGIKSALVTDFARQAVRRGYERLPLSQGRPGDIVYGVEPGGGNGGGDAHIGVVGANGLVYHNRSSTGRWSEDSLGRVFNRGRFGNNLWVLRAPQA